MDDSSDAAVIRRFFYAVFFLIGGFLFAIPKWIIMGTKASRQRKKMLKLQKEIARRPTS